MRRAASAALLAALLPGPGAALAEPPPDGGAAFAPVQHQELYLQAMRALAEGHPAQATELLMRFLEHEPQHAGAWLDLALSQCELGHAGEAERLFGEIERRFAPPPGIIEVIALHRSNGCRPAPPRDYLALSLGRGHDSNVNQGTSNSTFTTGSGEHQVDWTLLPDYLPKADSVLLLAADYSRPLNDAGLQGFSQLRLRRHDQVHQQDTQSLLLGLEQSWRLGAWRGRANTTLSLMRLDGQYYQRQVQAQVRATPPLALPEPLEWSLIAGLSHVTYPTRAKYDANTVELGNALHYRSAGLLATGALGLLSDQGQAGRLGGNRNGWYASALLDRSLGERLSGQLSWTRQIWRSTAAYAPPQIEATRHQDTEQLGASLNLTLTRRQSLQLEWRMVRNRENISLFQYNGRTVQLNWRWDNF
ncbi:hypothetical protein CSQ96_08095 [Janthinobacterium sp. BJB412]|nr:hypothetical protein CSQ96_08095 [Janthinobacterium sp. BJB412]